MSGELSSGDHVFLAFLARGPMSAYDIKKEMALSVSFFWSAQHSQVYQQASRLQRQGYIEPRGRAGARNRVILGLTDLGREAVGRWLREPSPTYRIYDQSLAKLYFADLADPGTAERLLGDQRDQHAALLAEFGRLRQMLEGVDYQQRIPYQLYTLLLGIRVEQAYMDWITSTLSDLATRAAGAQP
jgi:PadR family transcriptional regulator, regulatory protein AphA